MNRSIKNFYSQMREGFPGGNFHDVISLQETQDISWEEIREKIFSLPRGWYELSRLDAKDRVEFTRDYWLSKLPYRLGLHECIRRFFSSLDDVGIFIVQRREEDSFAEMVYSICEERGFYRGGLPGNEEEIAHLQGHFSEVLLPLDYKIFLQIHNGFWKATDCTGIIPTPKMYDSYLRFQSLLTKEPLLTSRHEDSANPKSLIPFYESFGMPYYQCFWGQWYPENEMGNVYYSSETKSISSVKSKDPAETMAFPTFSDWLMFYLEPVE